MKVLASYLVTLLGVFLVLNLLKVDQFGTPLSGVMGWILALVVLFFGITEIMHHSK